MMNDPIFSLEDLQSLADIDNATTFNVKGLWRAVILQAIIDATSNYKRTENRLEKDKARRWLSSMSEDFLLVCSMAGYDPLYVKRKAKEVIESRGNNLQPALKVG